MKLPPYAKPLKDLIDSRLRPNNDVYVFIGKDAWTKGKSFSISYPERTIAIPPWQSPESFIWAVKQCDILIVDTGFADASYIHELVYCLYENGANNVRLVTPDFSIVLFKKDI
jgi:hypothetical protein